MSLIHPLSLNAECFGCSVNDSLALTAESVGAAPNGDADLHGCGKDSGSSAEDERYCEENSNKFSLHDENLRYELINWMKVL